MAVHAVSDLHIRGPEDPLYCALLEYLARMNSNDTFVLGGDVFEFFLGTREFFWKRYSGFIEAISAATQAGTEVHYIEGNHDFHLHPLKRLNVRVHSKEVELTVEKKRFYFAHGDLVNQSDWRYLAFRGFLRSPLVRGAFRVLPSRVLDRIGYQASDLSKAKSRQVQSLEPLRKIYRSFAAARIQQGFDYVVLGHCHDLDEMRFLVGERQGHYMNVGFPRVHATSVVWNSPEAGLERQQFYKLAH